MTRLSQPIFAIFHAREWNKPSSDPIGHHTFAAVVRMDETGAIQSDTLNFHGHSAAVGTPLLVRNNLEDLKSDGALFFPISEESAAAFGAFLTDMNTLYAQGRLPFYYSFDNRIIDAEEVANQLPTTIDGAIDTSLAAPRASFQKYAGYDVFDEPTPRSHPKDLIRARANCVTLIQLAMKVSGIDPRMLEKWNEIVRGFEFNDTLRSHFAASKGYECSEIVNGFIDQGVRVRAKMCKESGLPFVSVNVDDQKPESIRQFFFLLEDSGAFDVLSHARQNFSTERQDLPHYISREL